MNTAAKGRRQEHRSMALFEADGYICVRAAGSRGPWDFVAIGEKGIVFCQVRSGRWPSPAECAALAKLPAPRNSAKVLHRWMPRAKAPEVRYI